MVSLCVLTGVGEAQSQRHSPKVRQIVPPEEKSAWFIYQSGIIYGAPQLHG